MFTWTFFFGGGGAANLAFARLFERKNEIKQNLTLGDYTFARANLTERAMRLF